MNWISQSDSFNLIKIKVTFHVLIKRLLNY